MDVTTPAGPSVGFGLADDDGFAASSPRIGSAVTRADQKQMRPDVHPLAVSVVRRVLRADSPSRQRDSVPSRASPKRPAVKFASSADEASPNDEASPKRPLIAPRTPRADAKGRRDSCHPSPPKWASVTEEEEETEVLATAKVVVAADGTARVVLVLPQEDSKEAEVVLAPKRALSPTSSPSRQRALECEVTPVAFASTNTQEEDKEVLAKAKVVVSADGTARVTLHPEKPEATSKPKA